VGFTTAILAHRRPRSVVHAFEPAPASYAALERTVRRQGLTNVVAWPLALGDRGGRVEMLTPVRGSTRLVGLTHVVDGASTAAGDRLTAECRRLDDLAASLPTATRITGLKLDVEDHETRVLEGARGLVERHRPLIFCELWNTENRRRVFALARAAGYAVRVADRGGLVRFDPTRHHKQDFFLLPDEQAAE
jgi:FkbM family methyltransferase